MTILTALTSALSDFFRRLLNTPFLNFDISFGQLFICVFAFSLVLRYLSKLNKD